MHVMCYALVVFIDKLVDTVAVQSQTYTIAAADGCNSGANQLPPIDALAEQPRCNLSPGGVKTLYDGTNEPKACRQITNRIVLAARFYNCRFLCLVILPQATVAIDETCSPTD